MNLISKLLQAARKRRHQRGGRKTAKRPAIAVEQLDHRQLLSVNFTGNVAIDFPATEQPGVVLFNSSNSNIQHPIIPPNLQPYIKTSGFDISVVAVSYDATTDTLSVGLSGGPADPASPNSLPVIAGDADDNGNAGTVNPAVEAAAPGFTEFYGLGGPEQMYAILDLANTGLGGDIVAGFSPNAPGPTPTDPSPPKPYEVALAVQSSNPMVPTFGTTLDYYTGSVYLFNSAAHPNLEFTIKHFSQLWQMENPGKTWSPSTEIRISAFAGSPDDIDVSDAYFDPQFPFTIGSATVPPPNPKPSPYILINPHEHRIIDTAHRDLVRVTVFGTSGFDVTTINPKTVELDGVHAIARVLRKVRRDEFVNETFVFPANQLSQSPGLFNNLPATLTGNTYSGVPFASSKAVLNIPHSARLFGQLHRYMGGGTIYKALAKAERRNPSIPISLSSTPEQAVNYNLNPTGNASINVNYTPVLRGVRKDQTEAARPVVSIPRLAEHDHESVPRRLRHSLNDYLS